MQTAGLLLKEARESRNKSIVQISKQTRIKEKFLAAIESSEWAVLPNFSVALGFARNYAQEVGLNPEHVVALIRRDFPQYQASFAKRGEISLTPKVFWTPRMTIFAAVVITLLVLGFYLIRQYMLFAAPPPIEIDSITGNEKGGFLISGKTVPSATLEVNGRSVLVEDDGSFEVVLNKEDAPGLEVEIQAISRTGKKTTIKQKLTD